LHVAARQPDMLVSVRSFTSHLHHSTGGSTSCLPPASIGRPLTANWHFPLLAPLLAPLLDGRGPPPTAN